MEKIKFDIKYMEVDYAVVKVPLSVESVVYFEKPFDKVIGIFAKRLPLALMDYFQDRIEDCTKKLVYSKPIKLCNPHEMNNINQFFGQNKRIKLIP